MTGVSVPSAGGWEATAELSPTAGTGELFGVVVAVIEEIVVAEVNVAPGDAELFSEEPALIISKACNGKDTVLVVDVTDDPVEEGKVILKFSKLQYFLADTPTTSLRKQIPLLYPSEPSVIHSKIRRTRYKKHTTVIARPKDSVGT